MVERVCLDTDFLIDFLRSKKESVDFVKENESAKEFATTYINIFELYFGAFKSRDSNANIKAVEQIISRLNILNFSDDSARLAGKMLANLEKAGKLIDYRDLFIGSIALTNGFAIKTNNIKHFNRIRDLKVI